MEENIKNYIKFLKNERNYSKLTVKNYAMDLESFYRSITHNDLHYLKL